MAKAKKDSKSLCPICCKGHIRLQQITYTSALPDGEKLEVPGVEAEVCDHCGEVILSVESTEQIDAFVAQQIEQLTIEDLRRIRTSLNVDQTQISDILGLGGKTYHRWEKGHQIPSRSMGYYLRLLAEFPEAFAWLRNRGWREQDNVIRVDFKISFPALAKSNYAEPIKKSNLALTLLRCAAK